MKMNKLLEITWKINSDSPLLALLKLKAFPSPTYFHLEFIINLYLSLSLPHADNERVPIVDQLGEVAWISQSLYLSALQIWV